MTYTSTGDVGRIGLLIVIVVMVVACERKAAEQAPPRELETTTSAPVPSAPPLAKSLPRQQFSVDRITHGAQLYREHCLQCHGPEAQGHPDWQTAGTGQFVAAPPLNGTGNTWRRKKEEIVAAIKKGASRKGVPAMPAYQGRLSDEQIDDIIIWFQVLWPPEVYEIWLNAHAASGTPSG
ncbi:MAG: c-type cytochrome [Acidiferrobacterales bacterium]